MSTEHLESLTDTEKQRLILLAKKPGEPLGIMLIESGWGSMLPTCVVGHMAKSGPAATSNKINIGTETLTVYSRSTNIIMLNTGTLLIRIGLCQLKTYRSY